MAQAQDILNYADTLMNQTSASIVAGLPDGSGETGPGVPAWTISPTTQLILWLTEGENRLARLCVPVSDQATATPSSAGSSVLSPITAITSSSGRQLVTPSKVFQGSRELTPANQGYINNQTWYPPTPDGDPVAWGSTNSAITLSTYTTQPTFTIPGYFIPKPVTSVTDPIDPYFDDFSQRTLAAYVAMMVCNKNPDNDVLRNRAPIIADMFISGVKEIYARMVQNDSSLSALFPPQAIDAMVQIVKQATPRT